MTSVPVLLLAAAAVGLGHAVLPDHWMPLAMLARARHYPLRRVLRQSGAAAVTHILLSLLLGGLLILIGLQFRAAIQHREDMLVGGLLLATGVIFLMLDLAGRGHHEHGHHEHGHRQHEQHGHEQHGHEPHRHYYVLNRHPGQPANRYECATDLVLTGTIAQLNRSEAEARAGRGGQGLVAVVAGFGAAASPDLTILPVFLAASALGAGAALGSLVVFGLVTFAAMVGLTMLAALGSRLLTAAWIDRFASQLTAAVLIVIGGIVAFGLA